MSLQVSAAMQPQQEEVVVDIVSVVLLGDEVFFQQSFDCGDHAAGRRQAVLLIMKGDIKFFSDCPSTDKCPLLFRESK